MFATASRTKPKMSGGGGGAGVVPRMKNLTSRGRFSTPLQMSQIGLSGGGTSGQNPMTQLQSAAQ